MIYSLYFLQLNASYRITFQNQYVATIDILRLFMLPIEQWLFIIYLIDNWEEF